MRTRAHFFLYSWPMGLVVLAAIVAGPLGLYRQLTERAQFWIPISIFVAILLVILCEFAVRFLRARNACTREIQDLRFVNGRVRVEGYSKQLQNEIDGLVASRPQSLREFRATVFPDALDVYVLLVCLFLLREHVEQASWIAAILATSACLLVWMVSARVRVEMKDGQLHLTPGSIQWIGGTRIELSKCTVRAREQVGWIDIQCEHAFVRLRADQSLRPRAFFYTMVAAIILEMELASETAAMPVDVALTV